MTIKLRPYQTEAISAIRGDWSKGHQSVLLVSSTGTGKTEMLLGTLAEERRAGNLGRALFVAHRKELIDQPRERIERHWSDQLPIPGVVMADRNEPEAQFVCATVQTIAKEHRLNAILQAGPITHLIIDEAHHAVAADYMGVIGAVKAHNPTVRILGVTATPQRADDIGLINVFERVSYRITTKDAISKLKCLTPFVAVGVKLPVDISGVKDVGGDYSEGALGRVMDVDNANQIIVKTWEAQAKTRPTMAFTATVEHARHLAEEFVAAGYRAAWVSGATPKAEREKVIADYKAGALQIITNCAVFTEGFDAPSTSCVIMARPTKSDTVYIQAVGRGLRLYPGKTDCLILDFVPDGGKSLVMGGSILGGKPKDQREAETLAAKEGVILDAFGLDSEGNGLDGDPDQVVMKALDLFAKAPVPWTFDGSLATAAGGQDLTVAITVPQDDRIAKADALKAAGQWRPEWDRRYEALKGFSVYAVNGEVIALGVAETWEDAQTIAQDYIEEHGDPKLSRKRESWRKEAATAAQRGKMRWIGVPYRAGMKKGEAAQAITHRLAQIELEKKGVIK